MARTLYMMAGWGLALLGAAHMVATVALFDSLTSDALWFLSGGLFMVSVAALNLLNRVYGRGAPGLRATCRAGNVVMAGFALASAVVGRASSGESLLVFGIVGSLVVLSMSRRALCETSEPGSS